MTVCTYSNVGIDYVSKESVNISQLFCRLWTSHIIKVYSYTILGMSRGCAQFLVLATVYCIHPHIPCHWVSKMSTSYTALDVNKSCAQPPWALVCQHEFLIGSPILKANSKTPLKDTYLLQFMSLLVKLYTWACTIICCCTVTQTIN